MWSVELPPSQSIADVIPLTSVRYMHETMARWLLTQGLSVPQGIQARYANYLKSIAESAGKNAKQLKIAEAIIADKPYRLNLDLVTPEERKVRAWVFEELLEYSKIEFPLNIQLDGQRFVIKQLNIKETDEDFEFLAQTWLESDSKIFMTKFHQRIPPKDINHVKQILQNPREFATVYVLCDTTGKAIASCDFSKVGEDGGEFELSYTNHCSNSEGVPRGISSILTEAAMAQNMIESPHNEISVFSIIKQTNDNSLRFFNSLSQRMRSSFGDGIRMPYSQHIEDDQYKHSLIISRMSRDSELPQAA